MVSEKNKKSWNDGAAAYSAFNHSAKFIDRIAQDPANAFHRVTWDMIKKFFPDPRGKKICVPSSGDNHAAFAFASLGASVTSCDISENQLSSAVRVAAERGWDRSIEFVRADTMRLDGVPDGAYDLVYTSNGVHVWIDDLQGMYRNIFRVMKPGGVFIMYEIHPFQRPFDEKARVIKPYDATGPFESETEITFGWRVMDIMNAITDSGLIVKRIEEMFAEKDYEQPFFIKYSDIASGVRATREEVDRMYDWRVNPMAALPNWISVAAVKNNAAV